MFDAAAAAGVALEINSQVDRLDLDEHHARLARDRGVQADHRFGRPLAGRARHCCAGASTVARRAWLEPGDVLNTLPVDGFRAVAAPQPRAHATRATHAMTRPADDPLAEIRRLYFKTTPRDDSTATSIARSTCSSRCATEAERERATVYMEGLAEMRKEFGRSGGKRRLETLERLAVLGS